ncbi:hypothetical protein ACVWWG_001881 [Bradyrhizobium sp. LB7.2]
MPVGPTGDEPEEALVEAGSIGWKIMCQRGLRARQLLGCLCSVVAKDEMDVKLDRQIGFDVPLQKARNCW